jgi:5-methylcytosine-specific restriction endonuclease McrA
MKIIWGINIPYQSFDIDWDATEVKRKEIIANGGYPNLMKTMVHIPCIRYKDFYFELCENCGSQITGGRLSRGWRSCSKECNQQLGNAWAHHTLIMERQQAGKRPMFFWETIRRECFERDNHQCRTCGKDIRTENKPGEAHHIVPISNGGTNELSNLKTLCYDCHKLEHSRIGKAIRTHKSLQSFE